MSTFSDKSFRKLTLLALPVLAACQTTSIPTSSPNYRIPVGSEVVVNTSLTIPADRARVYLQSGKVVRPGDVWLFRPHCWFLSRKVSQAKQQVKPGRFTVTRHRFLEEIVLRKVRYAALNISAKDGGGITAIEQMTELELQSSEQPDVMRLVCNHWTDPADSVHLTLDEMRSALGKLVSINIK